MSLQQGARQKLEHLIKEYDFTHAAEYVIEHTRQGVRLKKSKKEDYTHPCVSRVGGDPDLPSSIVWPQASSGTPMTFLAQLNLDEIHKYDESSLLPSSGMLYFFVGIDEPAFNIEHQVLFVQRDELDGAARRKSPNITTLEGKFTGYQLEARSSLEPPNYAYVDYDVIEDEEHDYEEYEDLSFAIRDRLREDVVQIFGYPEGQHDDAEYEAALMLLTGEQYKYSTEEALKRISEKLAGGETAAMQEIQDTLMLLEIDSDDDIGFLWWDAGVLQFFIRKEDLLAGRFDRTYCSLYSS
ncbi:MULTISPECIES: YwqG family protein [unclassified Paenibacillus]|uniref:YwqG family protein n=1 Tax=unclassified Paenibacillus TaxID=185978 RepID=UPI000898BAC9|nr:MULTISPECIES: YwqG family protein [unclassified Paenibacillus]OMC70632.1 hypothetical protein BK126_00420 [Paenibacillus sp. FSL H7-0326]SDW03063.1 Uncharacterized protein YwqG [Paenibacillus sp. PDC88]